MKNDTASFLARIRNKSHEIGVSAQVLQHHYMFECFLRRVAVSEYRDNFILKGGLLVSSMVGLANRSTIDLDALIKGIEFDEKNIIKLFQDVASLDIDDNVVFDFVEADPIREDHEYGGIRISAIANYFSLKLPVKFDFSTGDMITPGPIIYNYKPLLHDKPIAITTYNPETILAEKIQTIFWRGIATTRMRDYYDIWLFAKMNKESINTELFYEALINTAGNRDSINTLDDWAEKLNRYAVDENLIDHWERFKSNNAYTEEITLSDVCYEIEILMKDFDKYKTTQ